MTDHTTDHATDHTADHATDHAADEVEQDAAATDRGAVLAALLADARLITEAAQAIEESPHLDAAVIAASMTRYAAGRLAGRAGGWDFRRELEWTEGSWRGSAEEGELVGVVVQRARELHDDVVVSEELRALADRLTAAGDGWRAVAAAEPVLGEPVEGDAVMRTRVPVVKVVTMGPRRYRAHLVQREDGTWASTGWSDVTQGWVYRPRPSFRPEDREAAEERPSRGRPPVGPRVELTLPPEVVQDADREAELRGVARARVLREWIDRGRDRARQEAAGDDR